VHGYTIYIFVIIYHICSLSTRVSIAEPVETERLHRHPRAYREHSQRFLAHDMARKRVLHCHVDQDLRLYQGKRCVHEFNKLMVY
jgi:hypothetical protein